MEPVSRRLFLARSSLVAAAAGAAAAVPGLVGALGAAAESDGPAAENALAGGAEAGMGADAAAMTDPVVAHVTDLSTGEISIYTGTREIVLRDPQLANRLARAAR